MDSMNLWKSDNLKDFLRSTGSKIAVELDCKIVESYSLVEEMGLGLNSWMSSS